MKKILCTVLALAGLSLGVHAQTDDWANFGRFEQENREVSQPRVVLMGNSITELWVRTHPEFFASHGYVSRGISGQTTSQMLVRFRADVIDLRPQVVVICAGTNDIARNTGYISLPHILGNLISMVELARANGIQPVLCAVPPTREYRWRKEVKPAPLVRELNGMIRAYAEREKIPYVDYYTPMADPDGGMNRAYTDDEVHPVSAGYDVMEAALVPVVEQALKASKKLRRK